MTNNLTATGTPAFVAGKFGNAFNSQGGAAYFNTTTPVLSNAPNATIELWVKIAANPTAQSVIAGAAGIWLGIANNGTPNFGFLGSTSALSLGVWHHLAGVVNSGSYVLYVDGVSAVTSTGGTLSMSNFGIGIYGTDTGYPFTGQVDEVRISNSARYTANFTPPAAAFTPDANTVALYHLEADGTDSSAAGASDTTAPTVPTGVTATAGNAQAVISWTASTDAVGVTGYRVYQGGTIVGSPTGTTYTATGLANGTTYSFTVAAIDAAGNLSAQSTAATATPAATSTNIAPNDANIVYSPGNWSVSGTVAQTVNSGAYLRTTFAGSATSVVANFDVTGVDGACPIAVKVDEQPVFVAARAATVTIPLPGNGWGKHLVEITAVGMTGNDLWNTPTSTLRFTGFTVAPTGVTTTTTRRRPFTVLALGDSITNGQSTTTAYGIDGRLGWAYPLRDHLAAEVGVIGFSAQGIGGGGFAAVPPFTSTYNKLWSTVTRSFTSPVEPNLIIINMGTNDSTNNTTAASTTVLNGILAATTTAKIAVVQQWNGTAQRANWQAAIAASTAPSRVTYIDTTGWLNSADTVDGLHPWGYINISDLTPRLAAAVAPLLPGNGTAATPKRFVNVGGAAKAIG